MNRLMYFLMLLCSNVSLLAQNGVLTGKVTDNNGKPIPGVSVYLDKGIVGTTTDIEGNYKLSQLSSTLYRIHFSMIGYNEHQLNVDLEQKQEQTLNIILQENVTELGEVVISAGRNYERLSEIPASITVVNTQAIKSLTRETTNINQILAFSVPGLAPQTETYSNWGQTLRGRKLMVMIDGVPQSTPLRNGQVSMRSVIPNNIERIEVIKGATSIYGNGSDGGFVNYITKKAATQKTISGTSEIWGTSNLAKTEDALGGGFSQSLSGTIRKSSYYINAFFDKTGNKYDTDKRPLLPTYGLDNTKTFSFFGKYQYDISDKQRLTVSSQYFKTKQETPFEPIVAELIVFDKEGNYKIEGGYGKKREGKNPEKPTGVENLNVLAKYTLKDVFQKTTELATDIYYQKAKNTFFYSPNFKGGGQSVVNSEKIGFRPTLVTKLHIQKTPLTFTYGLDILRDETNQDLLDGRKWVPNLKLMSYAPYLQMKAKIASNWVVKSGIRYDAMKLQIEQYATLPYSPKGDGNFNPSVNIKGGDLKFQNLSFNIGIRYLENPKLIPYINFSQGFSLPDLGRTLRGATNPNILNSIDLEAAVTHNYEFGFLSQFKHLKFEAVAYYTTSNIGTGLSFNTEKNRFEASRNPQQIYGFEASVNTRFLRDKLHSGVSFSYVEGLEHPKGDNTKFIYLGGDVISPPKLTAHISYEFTPKFRASCNVLHVFARERFNTIKKPDGSWTFNYREVPVKAYTTINLSTSYEIIPKMILSAAVNNILNESYLTARSQWAAPLKRQTIAGEAANVRISLSYSF